MATLHESNIGKTRKIAGYLLTALPSLMILFSGIMKLTGAEELRQALSKAHLEDHMAFFGALEIVCIILAWIPRTANVGFVLTASYIGGIIATELSTSGGAMIGIVVGILWYTGMLLRKPTFAGLGI